MSLADFRDLQPYVDQLIPGIQSIFLTLMNEFNRSVIDVMRRSARCVE